MKSTRWRVRLSKSKHCAFWNDRRQGSSECQENAARVKVARSTPPSFGQRDKFHDSVVFACLQQGTEIICAPPKPSSLPPLHPSLNDSRYPVPACGDGTILSTRRDRGASACAARDVASHRFATLQDRSQQMLGVGPRSRIRTKPGRRWWWWCGGVVMVWWQMRRRGTWGGGRSSTCPRSRSPSLPPACLDSCTYWLFEKKIKLYL